MKFWALSYSIPANPSRYRVAVWKALKELGAVYLQPAVAVVPQREGLREALLAIRERVLASGGTAALLSMAYDSEADEQAMLGAIQAAREEEYGEITADARRLLAQLNWEERQETAPPDAARYALECRGGDAPFPGNGEAAGFPPGAAGLPSASDAQNFPGTSAGEARSTPGGGRDAAARLSPGRYAGVFVLRDMEVKKVAGFFRQLF